MPVLAVLVKSLERSKTRLSPVLSRRERAALSLAMLEDVLSASLAQAGWEVRVLSPDPAALEVAAGRGATPVPEPGGGLLPAVRRAEADVPGGERSLAVLLADLPFITAPALSGALAEDSAVVAVPAQSDSGTNLLIRRPPTVIRAHFGRSSYHRHRRAAFRAGVTFKDVRARELQFDLDRPADLTRFLSSPSSGHTWSACLEMGLPGRLSVSSGSGDRER